MNTTPMIEKTTGYKVGDTVFDTLGKAQIRAIELIITNSLRQQMQPQRTCRVR